MEIVVSESKSGWGLMFIGKNNLYLVERLSKKELKKLRKELKKVLK